MPDILAINLNTILSIIAINTKLKELLLAHDNKDSTLLKKSWQTASLHVVLCQDREFIIFVDNQNSWEPIKND